MSNELSPPRNITQWFLVALLLAAFSVAFYQPASEYPSTFLIGLFLFYLAYEARTRWRPLAAILFLAGAWECFIAIWRLVR